MIYINRSTVVKPSILESDSVDNALNRIQSQLISKSRQFTHIFEARIYQNDEVIESLRRLFHGKCAYCESSISSTSQQTVDHFRPKTRAMDLDGAVSNEHYWWLAYNWENLYLTCPVCNHNKRTRFPVQKRRVKAFNDVKKENALLVDPCNKDDFDKANFQYNIHGEIIGLTIKGDTTIDVLKLNRESLKILRQNKIREFKSNLTVFRRRISKGSKRRAETIRRMKEYTSDKTEFSGCIRYFLQDYCLENQGKSDYAEFIRVVRDEVLEIQKPKWEKAKKYSARSIISNSEYTLSFNSPQEKQEYFKSSKRIKKITIKNFKILKNLVIDIPSLVSDRESWLVLLGENGSGKSSILQAITLTLIGQKEVDRLNLNAKDFVNRNASSKSGFVEIELEGHTSPHRLDFSQESERFKSSIQEPSVLFIAFGSTRLMSQDASTTVLADTSNVKNLFDPYYPLPNFISWVTNVTQVKTAMFDSIAMALKDLLSLGNDSLIIRRAGKLLVRINADEPSIPIQNLSAGYQTIIVLTLNIIYTFLTIWKNYSIAEGIVVIDELGVHLHPRWKIQIVSTLRKIFPAVNFIVSTHEPLCLRGVEKGEVLLLKRDPNNKIYAIDDLPSPKNLTIEQLITSKYFGLISTFDPEIEQKLNAYYLLKSKRNLSEEENTRMDQFKEDLDEIQLDKGYSRMDLTKNAVDHVLVEKLYANTDEKSELEMDEEVKKRLKSIWKKS